ncbi:MAG: selenite/tellurite reduction operon b-type cytochrome membrane protein ExtQ [Deferrisomatales bacterium]
MRRAFWLGVAALLVLAAVVPAPLQEAADPGRAPNPAKAAWFLLWTQELVSYGNAWMYAILGLGLAFFALPWLPGSPPAEGARWFPPEQWPASLFAVAAALAVAGLTLVGLALRGPNWQLLSPF